MRIQPIVEGHGEVEAVQKLINKINSILNVNGVFVNREERVPRGKLGLEIAFKKALRRASSKLPDAIIVIFDLDDDCARVIIPQQIQWSIEEIGHIPVAICAARKEFEAWFLAGIESLRSEAGIAAQSVLQRDPEIISNAKSELIRLQSGRPYNPPEDQKRYVSQLDLYEVFRSASSFRKLVKEYSNLLLRLGVAHELPVEWRLTPH